MDHFSESHDRFEASGDVPEQICSYRAVELCWLASNRDCKLLGGHPIEILEKQVKVITAVRLVFFNKHPLSQFLSLCLKISGIQEVLLSEPFDDVRLLRHVATMQMEAFGLF